MIALLIKFLVFLFALSILILVHEFCHFSVAKMFKVKILRFSLGLGKPIFKWYGKNNIEYAISSIPIGGYVKMLDSTENEVPLKDLHLAFDKKPILTRAIIILAGPLGNVFFAILAFWLVFTVGIQFNRPIVGQVIPLSPADRAQLEKGDEFLRVDNNSTSTWPDVLLSMLPHLGEKNLISVTIRRGNNIITKPDTLDSSVWQTDIYQSDPLKDLGIVPYHPIAPTILGGIVEKSPAFYAGLKSGDRIISIDNHSMNDWDGLVDYIEKRPKETLHLIIQRQNQTVQITAENGQKYGPGFKKIGYFGVKSLPTKWPIDLLNEEQYPFLTSLGIAFEQTWDFFHFNVVLLVKLIAGKISLHVLGGPLMIWQSAAHAFTSGIMFYVRFLAILSITLAFTNLIPIPGLDGGYLLFLLYEFFSKQQLSQRSQLLLLRLGMILLVLIIFRATMNDLMRLF